MSRGYGYVQRFVLEELDRQWVDGEPWVDARTLAGRLEGQEPTRQRCRSVRRALRLLAADGLVEIGPGAVGRVAAARIDEVAMRRARRDDARELRRQVSGSTPAYANARAHHTAFGSANGRTSAQSSPISAARTGRDG